jgi:hypothetical protein
VVDNRRLRRWIGVLVFFVVVAAAVWLVPRLGIRSPFAIVIVPVLAVVAMKLVERRIRQWLRRWAERETTHAAQRRR